MVLEKSGTLLLTEEDLKEFGEGKVSQRLSGMWNLTYEELKKYLENNDYEVLRNDN